MTLIVAWAALDNKGPSKEISAMYIMSDSRISWGNNDKWDCGRKIFHFNNHPDILGYCGDVLFPTQVLSSVISMGDAELLFNKYDLFNVKSDKIFAAIKRLFISYPIDKTFPSFSIIHAGKQFNGDFGFNTFTWQAELGWLPKSSIKLLEQTSQLLVTGKGGSEFKTIYFKKFNTLEKRKSREIFQCFIDTLSGITEPTCGGPPQLVGVYRGDIAKPFGIINKGKKYFLGCEVLEIPSNQITEWRNELFERCSPLTKEIIPNAKRQPKMDHK